MTQRDVQSSHPDAASAPPGVPTTPVRGGSAGKAAGSAIREIVETLLLAGIIFLAVRMVVLNFRVDGESMMPNMHNEEMLLVNRNAYRGVDLGPLDDILPGKDNRAADGRFYPFDPPQRGDVVVFSPPTNSNKPYIKRIIGLPGEEVAFRGGNVFINGVQLDEPYIDASTRCGGNGHCDVLVEPDTIFVLGDNRENSSDSRVFGLVPVSSVIGKAWVTYWPIPDFGFVPHKDYPAIPETPMTPDGERALQPAASPESDGQSGDRPARNRQKKDRDGAVEVAATPSP